MKHVLCFGDSNTWGFVPGTGARYDEHTRWTGVLQDALGADWRVHEDGLNGRMTIFDSPFQTEVNKNGWVTFPAVLDSQRPIDVLVICLGTNDLKYHPAWHAAAGVGRMVEYAKRMEQAVFGGEAKILVISPIAVDEDLASRDVNDDLQGKHEESRKFPKAFGDMCRGYGVAMLDAQQVAEPSKIDCVHMEPQSHRALGLAVAENIQTMMKE